MLSDFNNSLKNNKLDLKNQNYSETKLKDSNNLKQKFANNLFENNAKESLSSDNLFTSRTSESSSSSEKYPYKNEGRFALNPEVDKSINDELSEWNVQKAGYSAEDFADAASDRNKWKEMMTDVIERNPNLSAAEKAERKKNISESVEKMGKKYNGMTYSEATNVYKSMRAKYGKYLAAYASAGRMEVGKDKETGAPVYGAEKKKLDDGRLLEVIREYGTAEDAAKFSQALSALKQFARDAGGQGANLEGFVYEGIIS